MDSYKEIPLTRKFIEDGNLKKGDYVSPTVELQDRTGRHTLTPGQKYPVVSIDLNNSELPASFMIKIPSGDTWPFSFDREGAAGQYFVKIEMSPEGDFFEKYGEIPYFILSALKEHTELKLKDLTSIIMSEKMRVEPENLNKIKKQIDYCISTLSYYKYIVAFETNIFTLTDKGKDFLNG
jgi:hypothetical protein